MRATVRVNQIFADLTGISVSRQLGRTPDELFPAEVAEQFHRALEQVFSTEQPVRDLEFRGAQTPQALDLAGQRLSGPHQPGTGALGWDHHPRCQRARPL